jgi:hypothetical protein
MKFLVLDSGGLCVDMARAIGADGNEVFYYCPWQNGFPKFQDGAVGFGIPEIKKVLDYAPYLDQVDVIFIPDTGLGPLGHYLREKGYAVFSAGLGETLEADRARSVEIMNSLGIETPETHTVRGVKEAKAFFKKAFSVTETNQSAPGKYFVKLNIWRGTQDSFPVENLQLAEYMLGGLESKFGPFAQSLELIIQKKVEGIECGFDALVVNGRFLKPLMIGFESSNSYVGYMSEDASIWTEDLKKFETYLETVNYRGFFSVEAFFDGKTNRYVDITARTPLPLGLLYPTFSPNFPGLIHDIAQGRCDSSHFETGTFLGGAEIECDNVKTEWLPLTVGKNTRLIRYMMQEGQAFSIPGGEATIGIVCAKGHSLEEVEQGIQKEAEDLNIFFSKCSVDFLNQVRTDYIKPLKDLGFDFDALTQTQNLKPVTKTNPMPPQKKSFRNKDVAPSPKKQESKDPLDEIDALMESIPLQKGKPEAPQRPNRNSSVFVCPVDPYGIPLP